MKLQTQALVQALNDCTLLTDPFAPTLSACHPNQVYSKIQVLKEAAVEQLT